MMKDNHIVLTTINNPTVLYDLLSNIKTYGHLDSTVCWVVGDKKTPVLCKNTITDVNKKGLDVIYLDIAKQDDWGKKFKKLYELIPYNNETRRNIGYLFALENGCKRLISIDDDNFPTTHDFISGHLNTGKIWKEPLIKEKEGFHNICEYLETKPDKYIYPRGFPFKLRNKRNLPEYCLPENEIMIGVTAGLWLESPDIDATTWLNGDIISTRYIGPSKFVLDQKTWSPINTQNTSIIRELIPAYLCVPMGYPVPGGKIERYGDIWGGYILQALMLNSSYYTSFGEPIVEHRRNPHNYLDDLRYEYWGLLLTDWLVENLQSTFTPESNSIIDRLVELSMFLEELANKKTPDWCPKELRDFIFNTSHIYKVWANVCQQLI